MPRPVADNRGGGCRGRVVTLAEYAPRIGSQAQRGEEIAGDELAVQRFGLRLSAAHTPQQPPGPHRGQLLELRRGVLEVQIGIVGEDRVVPVIVLKATLDATIVGVADAIELGWIGDRQRTKKNAVN